MTLFFIRHGETLFNSEGRVTGQRDIPLGPRGLDQGRAAGRMLAAILAERGIDAPTFHVSSLERARKTAEAVRAAMGLPPEAYAVDDRLKELSLGAWEGMTMADVAQRFPKDLAARKADPWTAPPTGGETYSDIAARVGAALAGYARPCVIVAHAGTGRAVLSLEGGLGRDAATAVIHQGRVLVVENGGFVWR